jgi:uncharacterized membrane protein
MSMDVEAEIGIERARRDVARYVSDWRNDPAWIGGITEARLVTEPPFGVGSQVERVATFLGRRIEYVNEVVEFEPETRLVMRSVKAPFPMTVEYRFDGPDDETLVRIRIQGDASGFYRLAASVLSRAVKRSVASDLARLKAMLEAVDPAANRAGDGA